MSRVLRLAPRAAQVARVSGQPGARAAVTAGIAVLVGLAVVGCDGGSIASDNPQSSGQSFVGSSYASTLYSSGHRPAAPDISGTTITGKPLSLRSYRGYTVVLNFWGSWCTPCREEAPALGTLAKQMYGRGVRFVGIDIRDEADSALAFMQTFGITYPSLNDPNDELALAFRNTVPPSAIPTTLVIDKDGRIAARVVGGVSYSGLKALILAVSGKPS